jgi:hypothetical protein
MVAKRGSKFIGYALNEALRRASSKWYATPDPRYKQKPEMELIRTCYAIAGPVLLGEKLCSSLPGQVVPCNYAGGSVIGAGCRLGLHHKTILTSGETIYVFAEAKLLTAKLTVLDGSKNPPLIATFEEMRVKKLWLIFSMWRCWC